MRPVAVITASCSPVDAIDAFSRCPVRLGVGELQRIGGLQAYVVLLPVPVEQRPQPLGGGQPEVMAAFRADAEARREVLVVDDLPTGRTLDPESFGHPAFLVRRLDRLADLLEPGHRARITHQGRNRGHAPREPGTLYFFACCFATSPSKARRAWGRRSWQNVWEHGSTRPSSSTTGKIRFSRKRIRAVLAPRFSRSSFSRSTRYRQQGTPASVGSLQPAADLQLPVRSGQDLRLRQPRRQRAVHLSAALRAARAGHRGARSRDLSPGPGRAGPASAARALEGRPVDAGAGRRLCAGAQRGVQPLLLPLHGHAAADRRDVTRGSLVERRYGGRPRTPDSNRWARARGTTSRGPSRGSHLDSALERDGSGELPARSVSGWGVAIAWVRADRTDGAASPTAAARPLLRNELRPHRRSHVPAGDGRGERRRPDAANAWRTPARITAPRRRATAWHIISGLHRADRARAFLLPSGRSLRCAGRHPRPQHGQSSGRDGRVGSLRAPAAACRFAAVLGGTRVASSSPASRSASRPRSMISLGRIRARARRRLSADQDQDQAGLGYRAGRDGFARGLRQRAAHGRRQRGLSPARTPPILAIARRIRADDDRAAARL